MTATDLVTAVANELRQATANIKLPLEHHSADDLQLVKVNVYEQFLPRDAFNNDAYYPLILVEWLSTSDELEGSNAKSTATVGLSMGTFVAENWGWKDALHLKETVRCHLLSHRVIADKFRLVGDAGWEVAQEQPLPFFYTFATLTYSFMQVEDLSWRRF